MPKQAKGASKAPVATGSAQTSASTTAQARGAMPPPSTTAATGGQASQSSTSGAGQSSIVAGRAEQFQGLYARDRGAMMTTITGIIRVPRQTASELCARLFTSQWGDNDAATLEHWGGIMDLETQCDLQHRRLLNGVAEEMNITISQARTLYSQIIKPQPRSWPDPFAPETFIVNF